MPYPGAEPDECRDPLVFNAWVSVDDWSLTPVSPGPAAAVRAGWAPVQTGQAVPMIGEDVPADADPDDLVCYD